MTKQKKHNHLEIFMLFSDYYVLLCLEWCLQWHDVHTHFHENWWTASKNGIGHNTPIAVGLITAHFFSVKKESSKSCHEDSGLLVCDMVWLGM